MCFKLLPLSKPRPGLITRASEMHTGITFFSFKRHSATFIQGDRAHEDDFGLTLWVLNYNYNDAQEKSRCQEVV